MALTVVTGPTAEPLSTAEAKKHLRITHDKDETYIAGLCATAREYAETYTRRVLVTQTLRLSLDRFPPGCINVPVPPLASISSVTYVDTAGDTATWASTKYTVDTYSEPGRIDTAYGEVYPSIRQQINAVTVQFVAGYATPFTVAAATDLITPSGRTFANTTVVRLRNSGGALPGGLAADTNYYVVGASGATMQLSATSGGSAIDITSAGEGTHFLFVTEGHYPKILHAMKMLVNHWNEHREAVSSGNITNVPMAVDSLLQSARWGSYV